MNKFSNTTPTPPAVKLEDDALPVTIPDMESHDELLDYLTERLVQGDQARQNRLARLATIDKMVSTWQQLSETDSQRKAKQEATGQAQAISMNLPLAHSHADDMVAYFAGIYAPTNGEFFYTVDPLLIQDFKQLVEKMREDAKSSKYFKEISQCLRANIKYNYGGMHTRWVHESFDEEAIGPVRPNRNLFKSIDLYNFMWDPSVQDVSSIPKEAEWAAIVEQKNRLWFLRREMAAITDGVGAILEHYQGSNDAGLAQFYKYPPSRVGVTHKDGQESATSKMDWDGYFPSLHAGTPTQIRGHELITMYCWILPSQFNISFPGSTPSGGLELWRFLIMDSKRIIMAVPVNRIEEVPGETEPFDVKEEIPFYLTRLNLDELGEEMRSIMELLKPFQDYGSFLMNSHIASTRSSIHGITVYDPAVIDMSQIESGEVAARIPSKVPNRDINTAVKRLSADRQEMLPLDALNTLMGITKEFFPSQALPSQIAGIDRAVTNQVASIMQGATRRLNLNMRTMDSDLFGPLRKEAFRNIADYSELKLDQVDEGKVDRLLGSGVTAANNEAAATLMHQLIFALLQNPESAQEYDVPSIFDVWARMSGIDVDMTTLRRQQEQPAPQEGEGEIPPEEAAGMM